jgi:hypothetical protein
VTVLLGLRIALAGGREARARIGLMAGGIALGVLLLLVALTVLPAVQGRVDRYAWHRTDAATPASAPDPAVWLPVTDRFAGRDLVRVQVAALGPRPPVPPGLERLPAPGEVVVSPALADLIATVPADQLRDRFPGEIVGVIGPDGLVSPTELVAVIGREAGELRAATGAYEIRGIEAPGEEIDLGTFLRSVVALIAVVLIGPVVVFVAMVTRVNAARREQRFAAIRLAGASRWQLGVLAATETATAAVAGTLAGWGAYTLAVPLLAAEITHEGMPFPLADLRLETWLLVFVLAAVPVLSIATTLVTLHRAGLSPLGARRRRPRVRPTATRLIPLAAGLAGVAYVARHGQRVDATENLTLAMLSVAAPATVLIGVVAAGPWVCLWVSRGLARLSARPTTLIAARRLAADPYTAFRAVGGAALAAFAATAVGTLAAGERAYATTPSVLAPGVGVVQARGADEAALAPILAAGTGGVGGAGGAGAVVVARAGGGGTAVVRCAELARVTTLDCPLPGDAGNLSLPELFRPNGFVEPGVDSWTLPPLTVFVPTDGTPAAVERVRTVVAAAAPFALVRGADDWVRDGSARSATAMATGLHVALLFVLLVAAGSLTVSVIAGTIERRRPFALLRASGMHLGELRRIALLESGVPLVVTVLGGVGTGLLIVYLGAGADWVWPDPGYFLTTGIGLLAALAVSMAAWPFMDKATRHDSVRYE